MAEGNGQRARRYRHHAEELRTMTEHWTDMDTLATLISLADDYDRMAQKLETDTGPLEFG